MRIRKDIVLTVIPMAAGLVLAAFLIAFLCTSALADNELVYYYYDDKYCAAEEIASELAELYLRQSYFINRQEAAHALADNYRILFPDDDDSEIITLASRIWYACQKELASLQGEIPTAMTAEEIIAEFLANELNLNHAAICGVLGNIWEESHLLPSAYGGSSCYGICQWTASRYSDLQAFCADNGFDYQSMNGQLWFLKSELEGGYKNVLEHLRNVSDTTEGARSAADYFCRWFEIPANTNYQANKRVDNAVNYFNAIGGVR